MQTVKFSILAEVTYTGDDDKELYIASRSNTQKVAKQTRFYTTQMGKKERKTQKQVILAAMCWLSHLILLL